MIEHLEYLSQQVAMFTDWTTILVGLGAGFTFILFYGSHVLRSVDMVCPLSEIVPASTEASNLEEILPERLVLDLEYMPFKLFEYANQNGLIS